MALSVSRKIIETSRQQMIIRDKEHNQNKKVCLFFFLDYQNEII
jgi:hypothetical protein